jgi:isopenicillin-N epimerase
MQHQDARPDLGDAVRHEWDLDPDFLTVNHGSYGATPRAVLAAQAEWQRRMEAQPTRFMMRELPDALRRGASQLASFMGAELQDLAFVENTTVGCNAVLRSLDLRPGDDILVLSHGYGAVVKTVRYVAQRTGARVVEAAVPFPRPHDDAVIGCIVAALTPQTKLAVLDHITSHSALVLPIAGMVAACQQAGVPVLVDGAHAPGHVDLDLPRLNADWYAGNCHKWLCAPKGSAFLWARRDRQAELHPVTISHGYGSGFRAEFDWTGTRDMSAYLAVPAALEFHERLGGKTLRARNAALAAEAATMLAARLGTETGSGNAVHGAMGLVRLPLAGPVTQQRALLIRERLLDLGTDAPVNEVEGSAWLRVSAQAYNTMTDFERLGTLIEKALQAVA